MSAYYITTTAAIRYYMLAIESGSREVGGYAKMLIDEDGDFVISDVKPLKQESTNVYFEIDAQTNALFLEELVSKGGDPADWATLFHTHPEGMDARMSGPDVSQITEMAKDLPGTIVRSMILPQGEITPLIHEAVCINGRVFINRDIKVHMLDQTGARKDLQEIGWFDKPATSYPDWRPRGSTPPLIHETGDQREAWQEWQSGYGRALAHEQDEGLDGGYSDWLDDTHLPDQDEMANPEQYIGEFVRMQGGSVETVVDAYAWNGKVTLVLTSNQEMFLEEVDLIQRTG